MTLFAYLSLPGNSSFSIPAADIMPIFLLASFTGLTSVVSQEYSSGSCCLLHHLLHRHVRITCIWPWVPALTFEFYLPLLVQIVYSLISLPVLELLLLPYIGSTLSAVLLVYIFNLTVDMCPHLIRSPGMPRLLLLDWTKQLPQITQIRLSVFHAFNPHPCLSYPILLH